MFFSPCFYFLCFLAARLVHGLGLVSIFGRLWRTNLQIPESEPGHCFGFTREVSGYRYLCLLVFSFFISFKPPLLSFVVDVAVQSLQGVGAFFFFHFFTFFLACSDICRTCAILNSGHTIPFSPEKINAKALFNTCII